jgi:NAD(P)H-hydrate epimerase
VTAEQIRELDRRAVEEFGIPGAVLMENAGRAVVDAVAERFGPIAAKRFYVACGTGNNGGDGFVIARLLRLAGADVAVRLAGSPDRIHGDARIFYDLLLRTGVPVTAAAPDGGQIKIDALLGTGIQGAPREAVSTVIDSLNAVSGPIVSVDIPSGVDSDTGKTPGAAVRADLTVTFGYPKLGLFLAPGADCAGEVAVSPIGFPWDLLDCRTPFRWLRPEDMRTLLPERQRESHKGDFGHLLVVGGSAGMSGAPTMAARAALRTGVGLVTVAAPTSAQAIIASKLEEAMTIPLPESGGAVTSDALDKVLEASVRAKAVCIGPGMSRSPGAQALICNLLRRLDKPVVLDADGLNALAAHPDSLTGRTAPTTLTPHTVECARLLSAVAEKVEEDRMGAASEAAMKYGSVVVLKGARTLICDARAGLRVSVNTTGNPGMATGGSGDTLTGIIGALAARGLDAYDAACLGVHLHGHAGDIAAAERGQDGMIAGDIGESIPAAIREMRLAKA